MNEFQRVTTEYVDAEDRIRLVGEIEAAETVVLWLTRRLLDRLIPHLTLWLERQQGDLPRADLMQSFVQQAAQSRMVPQVPVAAWQTSRQWLVHGVDMRPDNERFHLAFKSAEGQSAGIGFGQTALRQWLGILLHAYTVAGWPRTGWPAWMAEDPAEGPAQAVVLH